MLYTPRRRVGRATKAATLVISLGLLIAAAPGTAFAGTASVGSDGVARYQAAGNEVNNLRIGELPGPSAGLKTVLFSDVVPIVLGPGCTRINTSVRVAGCNVTTNVTLVRAALEDEDDQLAPDVGHQPTTLRFSSEGEGGDDTLIGTVNRDVLDGESGDDTISGAPGNDLLEGDSGNDRVLGGTGDDSMTGDAGQDILNGGPGRDDMFGGSGGDNLNADDGAGGDFVDCGESLFDIDFGLVNLGDTLTNCEQHQVV